MLRYLGIPSRVAAGFTSGKYDARRRTWTVTDHDAHAWVEVWFRGYGWLPFDPTPGRGGAERAVHRRRRPRFDVAATAAVLRGARASGSSAAIADQLRLRRHGGGSRPRSPTWRRRSAALVGSRLAHVGACFALLVAVAGRARAARDHGEARRCGDRRYLTRDPRRLAAACRQRAARLPARPAGRGRRRARRPTSCAALVRDRARRRRATAFGRSRGCGALRPAGGRPARRPAATRGDLRRLRRSLRRELGRFERARGLAVASLARLRRISARGRDGGRARAGACAR